MTSIGDNIHSYLGAISRFGRRGEGDNRQRVLVRHYVYNRTKPSCADIYKINASQVVGASSFSTTPASIKLCQARGRQFDSAFLINPDRRVDVFYQEAQKPNHRFAGGPHGNKWIQEMVEYWADKTVDQVQSLIGMKRSGTEAKTAYLGIVKTEGHLRSCILYVENNAQFNSLAPVEQGAELRRRDCIPPADIT